MAIFFLSLWRDVFLIPELYHGLSLGRIVTYCDGIQDLANSKNVLVNCRVAVCMSKLCKNDQSCSRILLFNSTNLARL